MVNASQAGAVPGPRRLPVRIVNAYVARIYRVALHDPVVSLAFQRVVHMLDQPAALFSPRIVWRVLRGVGASRGAEGRSALATTGSGRIA